MSDELPDILSTFPIKEAVATIDDSLKSLEDEIAGLQKRLEQIEIEKKELGKKRIAALARTAPVNFVFPELLSCIFEYASSGEDPDSIQVPLRLSEISHQWRKIILETPRAWRRVVLEIDEDSRVEPMKRRAQAFLNRSKATPIDIVLDCSAWCKTDDRESLVASVMDTLTPHLGRCVSLVAKGRDEGDVPMFLRGMIPHFGPTLTDFSIESRDSVRMKLPEMPYIERLGLDDVGPTGTWPQSLLQNLRALKVRYIKPIIFDDFLEALGSTRLQLEELSFSRCTFSFQSTNFIYNHANAPPEFPALKKLALTDVLTGDIDLICESISTPALEQLHLGLDSARYRYFKFMDESTGICLSRCPLKRLELEECTIETSELRSLISTIKSVGSTLQTLAFTAGELDVKFFEIMIAEPIMLPHLTRLECSKVGGEVTGRELQRLAQARAAHGRGVAPIQSMVLNRCRFVDRDMLPPIRQFVRDIRYTPYS